MNIRASLAYVVYLILTLLWLPFSVIGFLMLISRQVLLSRRLSVSATALGVVNGRWLMHSFDLRDDDVAKLLANSLPNNSPLGLQILFVPHYVYYKLSGGLRTMPNIAKPGEEVIRNIIVNRTFYFDAILDSAAQDVEQFVILGAGFDTRCYAKRGALVSLDCFELDRAPTQRLKRDTLRKVGVRTEGVRYLEVDFANDDWPSRLVSSGFDEKKKTVFLWEGVTMYITKDDIKKTLNAVKSIAPMGSVIVLDVYSSKMIAGNMKNKMVQRLLRVTSEEFQFRIDFGEDANVTLENFAVEHGWKLGKTHVFGEKTNMGPWMAVVELRMG